MNAGNTARCARMFTTFGISRPAVHQPECMTPAICSAGQVDSHWHLSSGRRLRARFGAREAGPTTHTAPLTRAIGKMTLWDERRRKEPERWNQPWQATVVQPAAAAASETEPPPESGPFARQNRVPGARSSQWAARTLLPREPDHQLLDQADATKVARSRPSPRLTDATLEGESSRELMEPVVPSSSPEFGQRRRRIGLRIKGIASTPMRRQPSDNR